MFKMSKMFYVILGSLVLLVSSILVVKNDSAKAEEIQLSDTRQLVVNSKEGLNLVKADKLKEYGISDKVARMLESNTVTNYHIATEKGQIEKPTTQATVTTSKDKRYVTIQYKITNTIDKTHTWLSFTVDTKENRLLTKPTMLKNEQKTLKSVTEKVAKKFKLKESQLKSNQLFRTSALQFYYNENGDLVYLYDKLYTKPNKAVIQQVSNKKPVLNSKTYTVKISKKDLK